MGNVNTTQAPVKRMCQDQNEILFLQKISQNAPNGPVLRVTYGRLAFIPSPGLSYRVTNYEKLGRPSDIIARWLILR